MPPNSCYVRPMSTQLTREAEGLDRRAFSVEEVERMLEAGILDWDDKFELIGGEIVPMNAQHRPHLMVKSRLARWFGSALDATFDVGVDGTMKVAAAHLFEPDIFVARRLDASKRGFVGIADVLLIIEVVDTTLKRDMGVKARAYSKAGLAELWVVDLKARVTHVHRAPGVKGFASIAPVAFDAALTSLSFTTPPLGLRSWKIRLWSGRGARARLRLAITGNGVRAYASDATLYGVAAAPASAEKISNAPMKALPRFKRSPDSPAAPKTPAARTAAHPPRSSAARRAGAG